MDNSMLSQEEIDALLKGESNFGNSTGPQEVTDMEKDAIGEIANISMGTAATTLSTLLGKKVDITTPQVNIIHKDELNTEHPVPFVAVDVQYKLGLNGNSLLVIKQEDAAVIVDLMMGGTGEAQFQELNELHLSAIGEAMNQMMGSAATSLSTILNEKIDISPPNINLINLAEEKLDDKVDAISDYLVKVSFRMVIGALVDSEMMQLIPINTATSMVNKLMGEMGQSESESETAATAPPIPEPIANNNYHDAVANQNPNYHQQRETHPSKTVTVKPAQFAPLSSHQQTSDPSNIDLLLDIPLQLSVELGKTKKTIKEILELASGSVIELDKLAGEPVDILVNGKLIAKGEVVVIDENFGVRVTDIVSPIERVNNLK